MTWWMGLIIGLFVGANIGLVVAVLCVIAGENKDIPIGRGK